jgi:hypothetical protein
MIPSHFFTYKAEVKWDNKYNLRGIGEILSRNICNVDSTEGNRHSPPITRMLQEIAIQLRAMQLYSYGHALDMSDDKIGYMRDSSDVDIENVDELRNRIAEDGYLYIKGFLDREQVLDTGKSIRKHLNGHIPPARCQEVKDLLYTGKIPNLYEKIFGETIHHYDFTWFRSMGPGKGTNPHCDLPYMGRGTHRHMTCWVPYQDVDFELGGLMVLEGSHKRMDLLQNYVFRDVDSYCENSDRDMKKLENNEWAFTGELSHNPPAIRNKFGGRWLVNEYQAGDLLTFGMFLVHAALDNRSENRVRVSTDSRYQRSSEPIDERWIGIDPPAHGPRGKRNLIC